VCQNNSKSKVGRFLRQCTHQANTYSHSPVLLHCYISWWYKECKPSLPDQMQTGPAEVACVLHCLVVHLSSVSAAAKQLPFFGKDHKLSANGTFSVYKNSRITDSYLNCLPSITLHCNLQSNTNPDSTQLITHGIIMIVTKKKISRKIRWYYCMVYSMHNFKNFNHITP